MAKWRLGFKSRNLFYRINAVYIALIIVLVLVLSQFLYNRFESNNLYELDLYTRNTLKEISTISSFMNEWILFLGNQLFIDNEIMDIKPLDENPFIRKYMLDLKFRKILVANPMIRAIYVLNRKEEDIFSSASISAKRKAEIKRLMTGAYLDYHYRISPRKAYYLNNSSSEFEVNVLSVMFLDKPKTGKTVDNVLMLDIPIIYFQRTLDSIKKQNDNTVFITDSNGVVVSYTDKEMVMKSLAQENYIKRILTSGNKEGNFTEVINNESYIVTYVYSESMKWFFIETTPYEKVITRNADVKNMVQLTALAILILGIIITILLANMVSSPFDKFMKKMRSFSNAYPVQNRKKISEEFEHISCSFQKMMESIQVLELKDKQREEYIKTKIMVDYLTGNMDEKDKAYEVFSKFKDTSPEAEYLVCIFRVDDDPTFSENSKDIRDIMIKTLCSLISSIVGDKFRNETVDMNSDHVVLILEIENEHAGISQYLKNIFKEIQNIAGEITKTSLSIGIGSIVGYIGDLHISYKNALDASNYRIFSGYKSILDYEETQREYIKYNDQLITEAEKELFENINLGKTEQIEKCFDNIAEVIKECTYNVIIMYFYKLYFTSINILASAGDNSIAAMDQLSNVDFRQMQSIKEIKAFFMDLFIVTVEALDEKKNNKSYILISKTLDYINTHYADPNLSAEMLADVVSLTPHYYGKIFKKLMNKSYNDYVAKIRVGKAKELLVETDLKISDIGEKCGFTNYSYFVTMFKKSSGTTPNTYRAENKMKRKLTWKEELHETENRRY